MEFGSLSDAARESAATVIRACLKVKGGERLTIVADQGGEEVAKDIWTFCAGEGLEPALVLPGGWAPGADEPPAVLAGFMAVSDVVICVTPRPVAHTRARREACERGARVAILPGVTRDGFESEAMRTDYGYVSRLAAHLAGLLTRAQRVSVVTGDSHLEMTVVGRKGYADTGVIDLRGRAGVLPGGEAFVAPLEGTAEGEIVVDGSIPGRVLETPLLLKFRSGRLVSAEGEAAGEFTGILEGIPEARTLAELGIGCNPGAAIRGAPPEDEKVLGSVHVALGTNSTFGGLVWAGAHVDAVIRSPDLYLDDLLVVSGGRFVNDPGESEVGEEYA
ncbi:MAG: aminopeptidase [Firmicutes bacterium]|nr:aminopeptidase [Bacillota bacterium]